MQHPASGDISGLFDEKTAPVAPALPAARVRYGLGERRIAPVVAGVAVGIGTAALVGLSPAPLAKSPGSTWCYHDVCHRVRSIEDTQRIAGQTIVIETSYYDDPRFDRMNRGKLTSNGEPFDADSPERVSSSDFPDGTELLLRNPENGLTSHVRVNDFGPFYGARLLDVTKRVAVDLGFLHKGVARLEVTVISAPSEGESGYRKNRLLPSALGLVGSLTSRQAADMIERLRRERGAALIVTASTTHTTVGRPPQGQPAEVRAADQPLIDPSAIDLPSIDPRASEPAAPAANPRPMVVAALATPAAPATLPKPDQAEKADKPKTSVQPASASEADGNRPPAPAMQPTTSAAADTLPSRAPAQAVSETQPLLPVPEVVAAARDATVVVARSDEVHQEIAPRESRAPLSAAPSGATGQDGENATTGEGVAPRALDVASAPLAQSSTVSETVTTSSGDAARPSAPVAADGALVVAGPPAIASATPAPLPPARPATAPAIVTAQVLHLPGLADTGPGADRASGPVPVPDTTASTSPSDAVAGHFKFDISQLTADISDMLSDFATSILVPAQISNSVVAMSAILAALATMLLASATYYGRRRPTTRLADVYGPSAANLARRQSDEPFSDSLQPQPAAAAGTAAFPARPGLPPAMPSPPPAAAPAPAAAAAPKVPYAAPAPVQPSPAEPAIQQAALATTPPAMAPTATAGTADPATAAAQSVAQSRASYIGAGIEIDGDLVSSGRIVIAGRIKGKVSADIVEVLTGGGVEGGITARAVSIDGLLVGSIAVDALRVGANGDITGDATYRSLEAHPSARLDVDFKQVRS